MLSDTLGSSNEKSLEKALMLVSENKVREERHPDVVCKPKLLIKKTYSDIKFKDEEFKGTELNGYQVEAKIR